jgi:hypothetical protein
MGLQTIINYSLKFFVFLYTYSFYIMWVFGRTTMHNATPSCQLEAEMHTDTTSLYTEHKRNSIGLLNQLSNPSLLSQNILSSL